MKKDRMLRGFSNASLQAGIDLGEGRASRSAHVPQRGWGRTDGKHIRGPCHGPGGGPDQSAITMYDDFKGQVTEGFLEEVTVERNSEGRVHQVRCDKGKRARQEREWQDLEMKPRKAFRPHLPGSTPQRT